MAAEHGSTGRGWLELKVRTPRQRRGAGVARAGGYSVHAHTHTHYPPARLARRRGICCDVMRGPAWCPQVLGPVGLAEWQSVWVELRFDVRCPGACAAGPCRLGSCRTRRALLLLRARGAPPALTLGWGVCFDRTSQRRRRPGRTSTPVRSASKRPL